MEENVYESADAVNYQSVNVLVKATGLSKNELCLGCITGKYSTPMAQKLADKMKERFEKGQKKREEYTKLLSINDMAKTSLSMGNLMKKVDILIVSYGSGAAAMVDAFGSSENYAREIYVADKQRNPSRPERLLETLRFFP